MKTVINTLSRMSILMFAILTMSFAGNPENSKNPAELTYLGTNDNHPRFQLNLNNTESDEFTVTIKNKSSEVLYKERIKGSNVSRKYQLNIEDTNASGITFEVVSKNNKSRVIYAVNETSRLVQDVSITEL